jgi:hypothetical protein
VSTVPTSLLNAWNPYDDHKFYRRHQTIHYGKVAATAYSKNKLISTKLEQLEARVDELERTMQEFARASRASRPPRAVNASTSDAGVYGANIECGY